MLSVYNVFPSSHTATQKKLLLAKKYTELKKSGKLDKFIAKKRKKNASRDRKQLPFKRTVWLLEHSYDNYYHL